MGVKRKAETLHGDFGVTFWEDEETQSPPFFPPHRFLQQENKSCNKAALEFDWQLVTAHGCECPRGSRFEVNAADLHKW